MKQTQMNQGPTKQGLIAEQLSVRIPLTGTPTRWVHALREVSLTARTGEVLAIVGESGCGKSVLALAAMGLLPGGSHIAGSLQVDGFEVLHREESELALLRGSSVGLIPQSAATHLNPVRTIGATVEESLRHHALPHSMSEQEDRLARVDLDPAVLQRYPHELSGGMAQRVLVALTVALKPAVLIADEPTSALDPTTATLVVEMLRDHADAGHAVILITHDVRSARAVADRAAVMYAGQLLEVGPAAIVLDEPGHDYTQAMLNALPENGLQPPPGTPSSLVDPPENRCAWHERVGLACAASPLREVSPGHALACQDKVSA